MLAPGDLLYHGSYAAVSEIRLSKCAAGKDFGRGFYLTSDYEQAQRFIAASARKAEALGRIPQGQNWGFVSAFKVLSTENVAIYEFAEAGAEWLRFIALNRRASLAGVLQTTLHADLLRADVVVGKVADDATNRVIATYLNRLYGEVGSLSAERTAVRLLLPNRLKNQICLRTEVAVGMMEPVGVIRHDV